MGQIVRITSYNVCYTKLLRYSINGLEAGTYTVRVDNTTVPADHSLTTGNDPMTVDLASGQSYKDADFGYRQNGSIGDRVWNDANSDGIQDTSYNFV